MKTTTSASPARTALALSLLAAAAGLCVATSAPRTHDPVYLSWTAFRASAAVLPAKTIERRGKILTHGHWLVVSDPNRGLHLIDNRDPKAPRPVAFVRVVGNVDIATRGNHLYADSFVDLLVFELTDEAPHIRLVRRVEDVFPYDPFQTLLPSRRVYPSRVERSRGVVVGWRQRETGGWL